MVKNLFPIFLLLFLSTSVVQKATAQTLVCPANIDFEQGNVTNWANYIGTVATGPAFSLTLQGGATANRQTIMTGSGVDPYGGFPVVCPLGGTYSLRLGNDLSNAQAERVRFKVRVPTGFTNYSVLYNYAIVLEDFSHLAADQSRFSVSVYDSATGGNISCAQFLYVAGRGLPGFLKSSSSTFGDTIWYKPWTTGSINLSTQGGKTVYIQFTTNDCTLGGHFGYAYIDMNCSLFSILNAYCPGASTATLTAPPGFSGYTWQSPLGTTIGSGQTITITSPASPTNYFAILSPYSGFGCPDTLTGLIAPTSPPVADFSKPDTFCVNNPVQFTDLSTTPVATTTINTWHWHFGNSTSGAADSSSLQNPTHTYTTAGTYSVSLTAASSIGCATATVIKTIVIINTVVNAGNDTAICATASSAHLHATVTPAVPAHGTYTYSWTPATGLSCTACASPIATPTVTTTYFVTINNSGGGCSQTDSVIVTVLATMQPITVTATPNPICAGNLVQLTTSLLPTTCGAAVAGLPGLNSIHTIGTGLSTTAFPFLGYYEDGRTQFLIRQTDLAAAGVTAGTIKELAMNLYIKNSFIPFDGFTIKMGCTALTTLNSWQTGLTLVYSPTSVSTVLGTWNNFVLTTPFNWDGNSNLIVEMCFDNNNYTDYDWVDATLMGYNTAIYLEQDLTVGCTMATAPNVSQYRPDVRLKVSTPVTTAITYSWLPTTALSNPNISNPIATPAATTTYTVTASASTCSSASASATITVNGTSVNVSPHVVSFCGVASATILTATGGATYSWTPAAGLSATSGPNVTAQPTVTTTYIVTGTTGSCSDTAIAIINVNPMPVALATPSSQSFCGSGTTSIHLSSNVANTTYIWTALAASVTGASNGSGDSIHQTLTNNTGLLGSVMYTITPSVNGCPGLPINVTVTVNPIPTLTTTPSTQTICSGNPVTGIILTSTTAPATFNWTVVQSNVSGASAGSGIFINQPIIATSTIIGSAIYTITPSANGCFGLPKYDTVNVTPVPVATATPTTQTFCGSGTTSFALTSTVASTTFNWIAALVNLTGNISGSGNSIAELLTNAGLSVGTATYTITPTKNGCPGLPITATATVNPIPNVTATPASQTICSGTAPSIILSTTTVGATFSWTVLQTNVTGATASSGTSIAQILTATSASPGTVTYTITPAIGICTGTPFSVTITVNPAPVANATPTLQTICSGAATSINLTSTTAGANFNWTVSSVNASGAISGSGTSIAQNLSSMSSSAGSATYTITPSLGICNGTPINVVITVNPTPVAIATPALQSICSGDTTSISLSSLTASTTFAWTVVQTNVTGASANNGATISQILTASTASSGTTTYTITPTANTCPGLPITATVTVNPVPNVTATPSSQSFCSNNFTGINLTSNVVGATFSWTVVQTNVTGATASSGNSIIQNLINNTALFGSANYTITPTYLTCPGTPINVIISVIPLPVVTATPASQSICSGATTSVLFSSTIGGTTYGWSVLAAGVTGASNDNGDSISQTLNTIGSIIGTANYTVTPSADGCPGLPIIVPITVNPIPTVNAIPAQTICSGTSPTILLIGNGAPTFNWTANATNVSGATNSSGISINTILTATTSALGNVIYTVTPSANGCTGASVADTVFVSPAPIANASPSSQIICSGDTVLINLSSNLLGTTYAWTANFVGVVGATFGSGDSISQILSNLGTTAVTATYTITPTGNGCPGLPITATATINPTPNIIANPLLQNICSGANTSIHFNSSTIGTTYSWTASATNVSGATNGSGDSIHQTLTATTAFTGSVTYTITPSANGCIGLPTTVTVTINPAPTVVASNAGFYCNSSSINLFATGIGNYNWTGPNSFVSNSPNPVIPLASVANTGTYTVTLTDINFCTATDTTVVTVYSPIINVNASVVTPINCFGGNGSVTVSNPSGGTSPYTFSWNSLPIQTTQTATGLSSGTYTVTVSDFHFCTDTASVVLSQPLAIANVNASLVNNVSCFGGNDGSVTVTNPSGGIAPYYFSWNTSPIQHTQTINGLSAGTYTVTVTDNGCQPSGVELVTNGNFNAGNSGFASAYNYCGYPCPLFNNGTYTVDTNASLFNGLFTGFGFGGSANYMIVDATTTSNISVWCQTITVIPNTNYIFSTYVLTLLAGSPAQLQFSANGINFGSIFTASSTINNWTQMSAAWNSGANTSVTICITDTNTTSGSNDFGLDNISFQQCVPSCSVIDSVIVIEPTPISNVTASTLNNVACFNGTNGSVTVTLPTGGTPPYSYSWNTTPIQTTQTATGLTAGIYTVSVSDFNNCPSVLDSTIVTQPLAISNVVASVVTPVACNGGNNGSVTVTNPTGGTSPYTFSWNSIPSQAIQTAVGLIAGTYIVTVTDFNLCTDTASVTLISPAPITNVNASIVTPITCFGGTNGSVTVSNPSGGTSPYTFSWNTVPTQNTQTATGLSSGTYIVTVTDFHNCTDTASIFISQPAALGNVNASVVANISCNGGTNGSVTVTTPTGGTTPYSYSWNSTPIQNTQTATGLPAGTYTVTVSDFSGCPGLTDSAIVTQPLPITNVNASVIANVSCFGFSNGSVTVTTPTGGTSPFSYSWNSSPIQTTQTATGLPMGTYLITVTDFNLCTDTASISITQPLAISNVTASVATAISCNGGNNGSVTVSNPSGGTSPFTFSWNTTPVQNVQTATALSSGTYLVTVTDFNLCTDTSSVFLSQPLPIIITASVVNNVSCNGGSNGSVTVSNPSGGATPYSYSWNSTPIQNTQTATGLPVGIYTVTVTDNNLCSTIDSAIVTQPSPLANVTASVVNNVSCFGGTNGSVTVTTPTGGTTPYQYSWNTTPIQNTQTATGLPLGTYTIIVTDSNNCTLIDSTTITQPLAISNLITSVINNVSCFGGTNGSATVTTPTGGTSPFTFSWNTIPSQATQTATGLAAGTYIVTATDFNLCTDTASVIISQPAVLANVNATVVNNILCNGGVNGSVTVTTPTGGTTPYSYSWNTSPIQNTQTISGLAAGTYTVTVSDSNNCSLIDSATVIEPAIISNVNASAIISVSCNGGTNGSATVTTPTGGTSPYSYSWNSTPVQLTQTATNLAAGTYTVSVSDANNCPAVTDTAIILQPTPLANVTASIVNNVTCFGLSNAIITCTSPSGGTSPYSFSWNTSPIQNTQSAINLPIGTYTVSVTDAHNCPALLDSITVTQPAAITNLTASVVNNVSCFGGTNGSVTVTTPTGGTSPYTYSWNTIPVQNTQTAVGLGIGTYIVTATDFQNCTSTSSVTVSQPTALGNVTASTVNNILCHGGANGSVTVTTPTGGTLPYHYSWNSTPVQTTQTATGLLAGTYTVTVSDSFNCSLTSSATVIEPAVIANVTASVVNNVSCFGGANGSVTVTTPTGGTSPYHYSWNTTPAQNTQTATGLPIGTYTVSVSDINNCPATIDSATITQPLALSNVIASVVNNVSCFGGNNGSVTCSNPSGGTTPYNFSWNSSPIQNTQTATSLIAAAYKVIVTDFKGCKDSSSITVTQPPVISNVIASTLNKVTCNGGANGSVTCTNPAGGTPPFTFTWNSIPAQNTQTATGLTAGTYKVTVTDFNGCTDTSSATITQPSAITNVTASVVNNVSCSGGNDGTVTVSAPSGGTPGYTYQWNSNPIQITATAFNLPVGNYIVTVTDASGCTATSSVTLIANATMKIDQLITTDASCPGLANGTATVVSVSGGTAPYIYSWANEPFQTGNSVTGLAAATDQVTVIDIHGCLASQIFVINNLPAPIANAGADVTIGEGGELITLDGTASLNTTATTNYAWTDIHGEDYSHTAIYSLFVPKSNSFVLTIYNGNDTLCKSTDTMNVTVVKCISIQIPNAFTPNGDGIDDDFGIMNRQDFDELISFEIYDRWGNRVFIGAEKNQAWNGTLHGEEQPMGTYVYFIKVKCFGGKTSLYKGDLMLVR